MHVAAVFVGFPGVPQVDLFPFDTHGFLAAAVSGEDLPVEDHVGQSVGLGPFQGFVQIWCLVSEHIDDLVEVAIPGGAGDSVVTRQRGDLDILPEPAQTQHGLPEAGQRSAVFAGTASAAFGMQQSAEVLGEFARNVEHGTIGNHGEPLTLDLIFVNPVLPGAPRPRLTGSRHQRARRQRHARHATHIRDDLAEITSLRQSSPNAFRSETSSRHTCDAKYLRDHSRHKVARTRPT